MEINVMHHRILEEKALYQLSINNGKMIIAA